MLEKIIDLSRVESDFIFENELTVFESLIFKAVKIDKSNKYHNVKKILEFFLL